MTASLALAALLAVQPAEPAPDPRLADVLFQACPILSGASTEPPPDAQPVAAEAEAGAGLNWTRAAHGIELSIEARPYEELLLTPLQADLVCAGGSATDGPALSAGLAARLDAPGSGWRRVPLEEGVLPGFLQDRGRWVSADGRRLIESSGPHPSHGEGAGVVAARLSGDDPAADLARLEAMARRPLSEALLGAIARLCPLLSRAETLSGAERRLLRSETTGGLGGYLLRHQASEGTGLAAWRNGQCLAGAHSRIAPEAGARILEQLTAPGSGWTDIGERGGERPARLFRDAGGRVLSVEIFPTALSLRLNEGAEDESVDNSSR